MPLLRALSLPRKILFAAAVLGGIALLWEAYLYLALRTIILVDGKRITAHAHPATVADLLGKENITVGEKDIVDPPLSSAVPQGGLVRVTRVTEKTVTVTEQLPFKLLSRKQMTGNLRPVELQRGLQVQKIKQVNIVYRDGIEFECRVIRQRTITATGHRLALLAKDGTIDKAYDLSRCRQISMVATAYYPGDPLAWRDGTITRLGLKMQRGIVAVDPKVIPLRTRVYIPGYGYGYAADTGSAIKRKRIDLGVTDAEEEKPWMHRRVNVYLLEKAATW